LVGRPPCQRLCARCDRVGFVDRGERGLRRVGIELDRRDAPTAANGERDDVRDDRSGDAPNQVVADFAGVWSERLPVSAVLLERLELMEDLMGVFFVCVVMVFSFALVVSFDASSEMDLGFTASPWSGRFARSYLLKGGKEDLERTRSGL
jgi:hypothetical protein